MQARKLLTILLHGDEAQIDGELRRTEELCRVSPDTTQEMEKLEALEEAARELRKAAAFQQREWPAQVSTKGALQLLEILSNDKPARGCPS